MEPADAEQLQAAYRQMRAIQSEVLEQVIAARIEADGGLVACLTLSCQALAESRADVSLGSSPKNWFNGLESAG